MADPRRNGRDQHMLEHACSCRSCRSHWFAFGACPTVCPYCGHSDLRVKSRDRSQSGEGEAA